MDNENLKAGDIVRCRIFLNGDCIDRDGILTERVKTRGFAGWYVDVETGRNGVKSMFSPDGDSRLNYRIIN